MTLAEIVTRITDECPDNEYTHDALNALRHLATLPAAVPDAMEFDASINWINPDCRESYVEGWNACREVILAQRGNAQDARDAARYRWLRDAPQEQVEVFFATDKNSTDWGDWNSWEDKDKRVDIAMRANGDT